MPEALNLQVQGNRSLRRSSRSASEKNMAGATVAIAIVPMDPAKRVDLAFSPQHCRDALKATVTGAATSEDGNVTAKNIFERRCAGLPSKEMG